MRKAFKMPSHFIQLLQGLLARGFWDVPEFQKSVVSQLMWLPGNKSIFTPFCQRNHPLCRIDGHTVLRPYFVFLSPPIERLLAFFFTHVAFNKLFVIVIFFPFFVLFCKTGGDRSLQTLQGFIAMLTLLQSGSMQNTFF